MSKKPLKTRDSLIGRCTKIVKGIYLEMKVPLLISAPLAFLVFFFNPDFSIVSNCNISELYEALSDTSGTILTIIGICTSIMYRKDVRKFLAENRDKIESKNSDVAVFWKCFIETIAIVIIAVVIRIILIPVLNNYVIYKSFIDKILFSILCFLVLYQAMSVVIAITNFEGKRKEVN